MVGDQLRIAVPVAWLMLMLIVLGEVFVANFRSSACLMSQTHAKHVMPSMRSLDVKFKELVSGS